MELIVLNPDSIRSIGTILYKIRAENNIGQTQLALRMGKNSSQVSLTEHSHKIPTLPMLELYLSAIGENYRLCIVRLEDGDSPELFTR